MHGEGGVVQWWDTKGARSILLREKKTAAQRPLKNQGRPGRGAKHRERGSGVNRGVSGARIITKSTTAQRPGKKWSAKRHEKKQCRQKNCSYPLGNCSSAGFLGLFLMGKCSFFTSAEKKTAVTHHRFFLIFEVLRYRHSALSETSNVYKQPWVVC